MSYIEDTITRIKEGTYERMDSGISGSIPPVWDMAKNLDVALTEHPYIKKNLFIYYERTHGTNSILAFRLPEKDSHLILRCKTRVKKDRPRCLVSIVSMQGEEAYTILNAIARNIIEFFRDMEDYYKDQKRMYLCSCTISIAKRTSKIRNIDYIEERTDELEPRRKTLKPKKRSSK